MPLPQLSKDSTSPVGTTPDLGILGWRLRQPTHKMGSFPFLKAMLLGCIFYEQIFLDEIDLNFMNKEKS